VAKLTRLAHKIAIQLHLVAESCTICSSCSRQSVWKLRYTPLHLSHHILCNEQRFYNSCCHLSPTNATSSHISFLLLLFSETGGNRTDTETGLLLPSGPSSYVSMTTGIEPTPKHRIIKCTLHNGQWHNKPTNTIMVTCQEWQTFGFYYQRDGEFLDPTNSKVYYWTQS
jgi:hypothetical protein